MCPVCGSDWCFGAECLKEKHQAELQALRQKLQQAKDDGSPLRVQTAMQMQGFGADAKEVLVNEIYRLRSLVDTLRSQNTEMQDARQTANWDYRQLLQQLEEVKYSLGQELTWRHIQEDKYDQLSERCQQAERERNLLQLGHDAGCTILCEGYERKAK
jgi:hypothetical protein